MGKRFVVHEVLAPLVIHDQLVALRFAFFQIIESLFDLLVAIFFQFRQSSHGAIVVRQIIDFFQPGEHIAFFNLVAFLDEKLLDHAPDFGTNLNQADRDDVALGLQSNGAQLWIVGLGLLRLHLFQVGERSCGIGKLFSDFQVILVVFIFFRKSDAGIPSDSGQQRT